MTIGTHLPFHKADVFIPRRRLQLLDVLITIGTFKSVLSAILPLSTSAYELLMPAVTTGIQRDLASLLARGFIAYLIVYVIFFFVGAIATRIAADVWWSYLSDFQTIKLENALIQSNRQLLTELISDSATDCHLRWRHSLLIASQIVKGGRGVGPNRFWRKA